VRRLSCLLALVVCATLGGCGNHAPRSAFCRRATAGQAAFKATSPFDPAALAEFDAIAAHAPAGVRDDLRLVHADIIALRNKPENIKNAAFIKGYAQALGRIDAYLRNDCGVDIPLPHKGQNT
jgi:hypothetical protein